MSAGYFTSNGGFAPQGLKSGEVVMQHPTRPIRRPWAACRHTTRWSLTAALAALVIGSAGSALAQTLTLQQQLARDIYKELVEINTVTATGNTARAADAMAARLRGAGRCQ